jgi:hypothetical protein
MAKSYSISQAYRSCFIYQQETPEQREAEKVWIKQQREELQRVKQRLEEILNPFSK